LTVRTLGRILQVVGLSVLPLALLLNLIPMPGGGGQPILTVGQRMLMMVIFGVVAFWIGRLIEGYARK
jgi:hypothetical protein